MSYCRFHNTLLALKDCYLNLHDDVEGLSEEEAHARLKLIELCATIAAEADEQEEA